jgi:hypothetical protein
MNRRRFTGIWIFLTMLPVASPVSADAVVESRSYNYSEGWALVSAPPPPGPYMAINLDPRIPGQDLLPMLPVKEPANAVVSKIPADSIPVEALENPPAAGMPVIPESGQSPAADLNAAGAALPPPVPGRYNRVMPAYNYPAAPRYPDRMEEPFRGLRNRFHHLQCMTPRLMSAGTTLARDGKGDHKLGGYPSIV